MVRWIVESIPHVGPIELFLVPPVFHNWRNKCGMYYPACGVVHIKFLLPVEKNILCSGGSGFHL